MSTLVGKTTSEERRNFLKLLALGGGLLATGKLFETLTRDKVLDEQDFKNFHITETEHQLSVSEKSGGKEILVIDKEGF